jgi:RHS repeat-associated protein
LFTASGHAVALTFNDDNVLVGTRRGVTYVVEDGAVVRAVDAITGRVVWQATTEGDAGRVLGPHGASLDIEHAGDEVHLRFGAERTIITASPLASRIVAGSAEAALEMSPDGLLLALDHGRRTELRYSEQGRLSDVITAQGHIVFRREEHENGFTVGATDGAAIDESVDVRTTAAGVVRTRRCCGQRPTITTTGRDRVITERPDGSVVERIRTGGVTVTNLTLPSGATRTWTRAMSRTGDVVESTLEHAGETWVTRLDAGTGEVEARSPGGRVARSRYEDGRQTRRAALDGTWQEFDWADGVITIAGTYGSSSTEFDGSTTRIEHPFGTIEYVDEPDALQWTDANGVTMTERVSEGAGVVTVNDNPYLETVTDDTGNGVTHGDELLAGSRNGAITLEGELESTDDGASVTIRGDGVERTIEYAGRRIGAARTPEQDTTLRWDGNELRSLHHEGIVTGAVEFEHDSHGRLRSMGILGQSYEVSTVDGHMSRLGDLSIELDPVAIRPRNASVGALAERYEYDDAGRLTESVVEFDGTEVFTDRRSYDDASRVSKRRLGAVEHRYEYEGDRLATVAGTDHRFSYDANGRLVGIGGTTIDVSNVGAPTAVDGTAITMTFGRRIAGVGGSRFSYNAAGELTEISTGESNIRILRDWLGRPIEIDRDGQVRRLVWGTAGPVALLDGDGNVLERYVGPPGSRVPSLVVRDDATLRLITDRNGSPLALVDVETGETQSWEWSPYGMRLHGPEFLFGFAGGIELGAGVTDIGARSYVAAIGRWLQWDPLLHRGGGTDLYGYAANDPVNRYDPTGMEVKYCVGPSQFGGLLDWIPHAWIEFDGKRRGQGPGEGNELWSEFLTEWKEHEPRKKLACIPAPMVDEDCVDKLTKPGSSSGLYPVAPNLSPPIPFKPNVCFTVAVEVLLECLAVGIVTSELEGFKDLLAKMNPGLEECCGDDAADPVGPEGRSGAGKGASVGQQPIESDFHDGIIWAP